MPQAWHWRTHILPLEGKYGRLEVSEAQPLRQPEEENRKQLVAEQALDIVGFKAVLLRSDKTHRLGDRPRRYFGPRRTARNGMPVYPD
jgi:hypothetical protein